ncbi:hypothetical protein HGRIS_003863 [Hohenbuehelia grisea]|uniref:Protein arginine methyltransferase NDUFAF7 n=1 Tax=Hohenbuehelia grisea TaxID=104357 RepID=A0ABR3JHJ1_9AGAR
MLRASASRTASLWSRKACRSGTGTAFLSARYGGRNYSTGEPAVTPIEQLLLDRIRLAGPISFATYMQTCLSHPTEGYYMNHKYPVFGTRGDFITSPEISQVFGEIIGLWLVSRWMAAGEPAYFRMVELGPGRGTLMADVLGVVNHFIPHSVQRTLLLVETSPHMRELQRYNIQWPIKWFNSIEEITPVPYVFTMVIAHEFFDALPMHILQRTERGWQELQVAESTSSSARFQFVLAPPNAMSAVLAHSSERFHQLPVGSRIEVSRTGFSIARRIGEIIELNESIYSIGGCGLIIDYGGDTVHSNSFRAFKNHKIVDVFHRPGECDLTANVDFAYLRESMSDIVNVHGPVTQNHFLKSMHLDRRIRRMVEHASDDERKEAIRSAAERLADLKGMGTQYKVMGLTSKEARHPVFPF